MFCKGAGPGEHQERKGDRILGLCIGVGLAILGVIWNGCNLMIHKGAVQGVLSGRYVSNSSLNRAVAAVERKGCNRHISAFGKN